MFEHYFAYVMVVGPVVYLGYQIYRELRTNPSHDR